MKKQIPLSKDTNSLTKGPVEEGCSEEKFIQLLRKENNFYSVNNALLKACEIGANCFFVKHLLQHSKVDIKIKNKQYEEILPIHLCCNRDTGHNGLANLRLLLKHGDFVNIQTNKGATPLHLASRRGLPDHVNLTAWLRR